VTALLIVAGIGALVAAIFIYMTRSAPNGPQVIGNNSPWPTTLSSDEPPYLPSVDMDFNRLSEPEVAELLRRQHAEPGQASDV